MNQSRVEALTDGIVAIAATIMVLELSNPPSNDLAGLLSLRHTFLAYVNSFFMIYTVWYLHHDLFYQAKFLSKHAFLINGIWVFMLTLVPFSSAWVGTAPDAFLPEFLYPLNLLLWSMAFHWLDHQIRKDNPELSEDRANLFHTRIIMYCCYLLCMILAYIKPVWSIYLICTSSVVLFIPVFVIGNKRHFW